jgi:hypothetical protein
MITWLIPETQITGLERWRKCQKDGSRGTGTSVSIRLLQLHISRTKSQVDFRRKK